MKKLFIMTVTLLTLASPIAGRTDIGNMNQFAGVWEAVDPVDGSHQILSIANNLNGTANLQLFYTYLTPCDGARAFGESTTNQAIKSQSLISGGFIATCFGTTATQLLPTTLIKNPDGTLTRIRATLASLIYHQISK
jgi:hypothetical protein